MSIGGSFYWLSVSCVKNISFLCLLTESLLTDLVIFFRNFFQIVFSNFEF